MSATVWNDSLLEQQLYEAAFGFVDCRSYEDESYFGPEEARSLFADLGQPPALLSFFRAAGPVQDGRSVFVWMARRKAIVLEEGGWDGLPEATRCYFDALARLAGAFAFAAPVAPGSAPVKIVAAGQVKLRDTIFEKGRRAGEKTGGDDLSPGQPVSTAQVHIERPQHAPAMPSDIGGLTLEGKIQLMKQLGLAPPISADKDDERMVNAAIRERLGIAEAIEQPIEAVNFNQFHDGEPISGKVFIQKPPVLRANAPKALRVDDDAGPERAL